mmetsp:Transcript_34200/g.100681  ORF Transcript_34200/g.100681 Transcript_34200/m.100681 type:complete len:204 (-) Transcript_34200:1628-2239(-)
MSSGMDPFRSVYPTSRTTSSESSPNSLGTSPENLFCARIRISRSRSFSKSLLMVPSIRFLPTLNWVSPRASNTPSGISPSRRLSSASKKVSDELNMAPDIAPSKRLLPRLIASRSNKPPMPRGRVPPKRFEDKLIFRRTVDSMYISWGISPVKALPLRSTSSRRSVNTSPGISKDSEFLAKLRISRLGGHDEGIRPLRSFRSS